MAQVASKLKFYNLVDTRSVYLTFNYHSYIPKNAFKSIDIRFISWPFLWPSTSKSGQISGSIDIDNEENIWWFEKKKKTAIFVAGHLKRSGPFSDFDCIMIYHGFRIYTCLLREVEGEVHLVKIQTRNIFLYVFLLPRHSQHPQCSVLHSHELFPILE